MTTMMMMQLQEIAVQDQFLDMLFVEQMVDNNFRFLAWT